MLKYWPFIIICFFFEYSLCQAQITTEELKNHIARKAYAYKDWQRKQIVERISAAPEIIVDYLKKDNLLNGYPEVPVSKKCDNSFMADLRGAIAELPEPVKEHIRAHLVGIFTVSNLGTTGYTEILYNFDVNRLGFIVLDVDYLERSANDWATWKENSPFRNQGGYRVNATIEPKESNNRRQAIQFILTHEIGHLVGAIHDYHPDWVTGGDPTRFAYSKISWFKRGDKVLSRYDEQFLLRKQIGYYMFEKSPMSSDRILECYHQLNETDFSSLYAATNMWDDFAETYVIYVHAVIQKKPWKVDVFKGDTFVKSFDTFLLKEKGSVKKKFMDAFYSSLRP